jgi:hypothetical protein
MIRWATFAILLPAFMPVCAMAQESTAASEGSEPLAEPVNIVDVAKAASPFQSARVLDSESLQRVAGREDLYQLSQADLTAEVSRNSIGDNSITGEARIDGNAFQNMSGLSILNVNTGNNVAINAAMNVTLSISPAP